MHTLLPRAFTHRTGRNRSGQGPTVGAPARTAILPYSRDLRSVSWSGCRCPLETERHPVVAAPFAAQAAGEWRAVQHDVANLEVCEEHDR